MRAQLLSLAGIGVLATACTVVNPPPQAVAVATPAEQTKPYCREYTSTAIVDGKPQQTVGTACQDPDGRWRIVDAAPTAAGTAQPTQTVIYPSYPYYPYPYYAPYPYYGPFVGLGVGFRFGGGHHHHH